MPRDLRGKADAEADNAPDSNAPHAAPADPVAPSDLVRSTPDW
jgi:hypothetical protein